MSGLFFSGQDKVTVFLSFFLLTEYSYEETSQALLYLSMYMMGWEDMKFLYLNCGLKRIFSV